MKKQMAMKRIMAAKMLLVLGMLLLIPAMLYAKAFLPAVTVEVHDNATTTDLAEGTNLYYTDARARSALSVSGSNLSYDNATGVFSLSGSVDVANGGTGVATTTPYGVITGGTTATGALQNAGTGTSGQVLVSQGSAALPAWGSYEVNRNMIINGSMRVAQRGAPDISATSQYGKVDRWKAYVGGSGLSEINGTLTQALPGSSNTGVYALRLNAISATGTNVAPTVLTRLEAADAIKLKNKTGVFQVKVWHDISSAKNYTITINKATSSNNFSSVTQIGTSGNIAVNGSTVTTISYAVAMGDCSNGIEVIVSVASGNISSNTFEFAEAQLETGSTATPFEYVPIEQEISKCQRYFQKSYDLGVAPGSNSQNGQITSLQQLLYVDILVQYRVSMRAVPTVTFYNPVAGTAGKCRNYTTGAELDPTIFWNSAGENGFAMYTTTGIAQGVICHWAADAEL